ncbi:MAG TPA: hypothetical protein VLK30_08865 [Candidatus Limnocylindrales bacterium]|nr:hypothetical protein [Candidatus Limnocylindrales bacterium]
MKATVVVALTTALLACTDQTIATPSPSPTSPAQSQAADLRTHLDLLLAEQVMIIAKESAAAVNHSDEYSAYTALLATNSADLTNQIARSFGNTSAIQFAQLWNAQNGYLVDYAIRVVTHNDDKAAGAITSLTGTFTPQFAKLVTGLSQLPLDPITQLLSKQVQDDKAVIDGVFAGNFKAYYADLHAAYEQTSRFGDLLAEQVVLKFPDKFPGDPATPAVDARVKLNLLLQEHSYLASMVTSATINGRDGEKVQALGALSLNVTAMQALIEDQRFSLVWAQEVTSLAAYAGKPDDAYRRALTGTFVNELASFTRAPASVITNHVNATIKVIDDQRSKAPSVADDDRAAATSMQPIADSIR